MHWVVVLVCWVVGVLTLLYALCRTLSLCSLTPRWLLTSNTEEKSNFTRCGIYNANGYLVRLEVEEGIGEHHNPLHCTSLTARLGEKEVPPQPLRPAPNKPPKDRTSSPESCHYNIEGEIGGEVLGKEIGGEVLGKEIGGEVLGKEIVGEEIGEEWRNLDIYQKPSYQVSSNPFLPPTITPPPLKTRSLSDDLSSGNTIPHGGLRRKHSSDCVGEELYGGGMKRAVSCESVSSDTSLGPLETAPPSVTGQLCISLRCFRINCSECLLAVNVIEARNLIGESPNTFVGIFLAPDHQGGHFKTKICKGTTCPSYNETFLVDMRGSGRRTIRFHVYQTTQESCLLLGEADMSLQDAASYKQPVTTWLTLTDTEKGVIEFGELMLSTSYLPTAERLTVILTRARRLPNPTGFNYFVKIYLLRNGKKVSKKRSSVKRNEPSATFNEAFIFSIPPSLLSQVQVRVTLVYYPANCDLHQIHSHQKVGHILLGQEAKGKAGNHWHHMVTSLRRPVTMWHALRRPHDLP